MAEEDIKQEAGPLTREEWIAKVRSQGRDNTIREEMIRLGFWSNDELSSEEQRQQATEDEEYQQLLKELNKLKAESAKLSNLNELLKIARKKRIEESKRKRAERKARREREQAEAAQRWQAHKQTHVIHAGRGVSGGLQSTVYDEAKLIENNLPLIRSSLELAEAMEIPVGRLKWLTYHRKTATLNHYQRFTIPKKSGGRREISAPKKSLRAAQQWVKTHILDALTVHPAARGFVSGKSTLDHAEPHLQQAAVVKMDLKDFFPTIRFRRVKGFFHYLGYSEAVSTIFALLCTEPPRKEIQFNGTRYYVAMDERQLPQGACTSPALSNLICRRLDQRLRGLAEKHGFHYTRYADDLAFSCGEDGLNEIGAIINTSRDIIRFEGFAVNEEKTRILRASNRQNITGIVVNQKPNIRRKDLRAFRALLYSVEKNGLEQENRHNHPHFWDYIKGYASYIRMVRPDLEEKLAPRLLRISQKHGLHAPDWCKQVAAK
ncbi:reverse transcriptase family protein [Desmospora activa]|uniref:RNA-directed DNA polymerase n=1 Tax=Desmospora activa DSM 45169 TaxID=1121389 RepID=A0A2T4ZAA0_9BACL|nr:reverse transcriptase family protein [Desmospora activa]PTM58809.1 retron-type reverse transcriptase [Desmospora activa DSM 45169]